MNWLAYAKATESDPFSCLATLVSVSGVAKLRVDRHVQATGVNAKMYPVGFEGSFALSIFDAPPTAGDQVRLEWAPDTNWKASKP